jgi:hypothetical protein
LHSGRVPLSVDGGRAMARALVASCGGSFDLSSGATNGVVAQIVLPVSSSEAIAS